MKHIKTIFPLLLWLLHVHYCCGESTTELKSFHGNSAWEIVETSEYGVLFLITYFLILMCKTPILCQQRGSVSQIKIRHSTTTETEIHLTRMSQNIDFLQTDGACHERWISTNPSLRTFIGPVKAFRGNSPDNQFNMNNLDNSDNITKLLVIQSQ